MNTNTKTKATTAYPLVICGVFAAVMVVCSWIAIPLPSGVPINLAVLGTADRAFCLFGTGCLAAVMGDVRPMRIQGIYAAYRRTACDLCSA